jgi:uncharacterized protein (TIGR02452 family)
MMSFVAIAKETNAIVEAGEYVSPSGRVVALRDAIDRAVTSTRVLREAELEAKKPTAPNHARVHLWPMRSGACAQRLLAQGAHKVALLNYANGTTPGGSYLGGSRAQEESLCRCSALYRCLTSERAKPFYDDNIALKSEMSLGNLIVSDDVPFFRDEDLNLLEDPFVTTVITGAAPRVVGLKLDERSLLPAIFARRTRYVFAAAADAKCDAVIVGPWGCGAFRNDPKVVAAAFADAVNIWRGAFKDIVFATWGHDDNRIAFEQAISPLV